MKIFTSMSKEGVSPWLIMDMHIYPKLALTHHVDSISFSTAVGKSRKTSECNLLKRLNITIGQNRITLSCCTPNWQSHQLTQMLVGIRTDTPNFPFNTWGIKALKTERFLV